MRKNVFLALVALFALPILVAACGGGKGSPTAPTTGIGGGTGGTGGGTSGPTTVERVQLLELKFVPGNQGCTGCPEPPPLAVNADGTYGMVALKNYMLWMDMTNPKKAGRVVTVRVISDGLAPTPNESVLNESANLNSILQVRSNYGMTNRLKDRYVTTVTITETGPDLAEPTVITRELISYMLPS